MIYVIVHRFDRPTNKYGLHVSEDNCKTFKTLGLFTKENLDARLNQIEESTHQVELSVEELIDTAPIEWHKIMRSGDPDILSRFTTFATTEESTS